MYIGKYMQKYSSIQILNSKRETNGIQKELVISGLCFTELSTVCYYIYIVLIIKTL